MILKRAALIKKRTLTTRGNSREEIIKLGMNRGREKNFFVSSIRLIIYLNCNPLKIMGLMEPLLY